MKLPTASRHQTLYADASVALRRGLMLTAERYVENAGVSNNATDARIPSWTGASGSTRFATRLQREEGAVGLLDGPHC